VVLPLDNFIRRDDTLAPGPDLIAPWARSDAPGYVGGGNKFDLGRWDGEYFERLESFIGYAREKDVIVEICFFNCQYPKTYPYCPLHEDANIQGVGGKDDGAFQTLSDKSLTGEQLKYIEKIIVETNKFNNVIYEFVDEPTLYGAVNADCYNWIDVLIDHAARVEEGLPKKHLFAQQMMYGVDFSDDGRISINTAQYTEDSGPQIGGLSALTKAYGRDKPIEMNETVSLLSEPSYYERDAVESSRVEAWEFMIGGGAAFNQLNACFNVKNPSGDHPLNREVMNGLKNLRTLIEGMDFVRMRCDGGTIREMSVGGRINGISEEGRQYLFYIHHSFPNLGKWRHTHYLPNFGEYRPVLTVKLPSGSYAAEFIDPATLAVLSRAELVTGGDEILIECPKYKLDLAVKLTAAR